MIVEAKRLERVSERYIDVQRTCAEAETCISLNHDFGARYLEPCLKH